MRPLTPKQQRFINAYSTPGAAAFGNATESARVAGYKGSGTTLGTMGAENLTKPAVVSALDAIARRTAETTELTKEKVLKDLEEARSQALANGVFSAAISASIAQGKHLRMFVDRLEVQTPLDDVPDEELEQLLENALAELRR